MRLRSSRLIGICAQVLASTCKRNRAWLIGLVLALFVACIDVGTFRKVSQT